MAESGKGESRSCSPRLGGGDGAKLQGSARKRTPVASCRKFGARAKQDPGLRLKLERALKEEVGKAQRSTMKKASTLAEFTPTKRAVKAGKTAAAAAEDAATAALHATPRRRRPVAAPRRPEGAVAAACRRLLLLAWRRCRLRLREVEGGNLRRAGQIAQLELQVDVLKNLQDVENQKRADALGDFQKIKKKYEVLELENAQLVEEVENLRRGLENSHSNLEVVSEQLAYTQEQLSRKKDQRKTLLDKLSNCESQLDSKDSLITELRENLKNLSADLRAVQARLKSKEGECSEVAKYLEEHADWNESLKAQVSFLTIANKEMEDKVLDLESSLKLQESSCQLLSFENSVLKETVLERTCELEDEKKKSWLKNTKEFALLSVWALQKIAHIMLPAYNT